jgi:carbon monoxide dehydrogenase subunit G
MPPIVTSIEVDRPAADVFAYATDPNRFAEWQQGVVSGHMEGNGDLALGDHCVTTRRIGRADRASTSELVAFDPPRYWSVRGIDGPIRARVDVTVEPRSDTRAQLTIAVDFEGHGIGRLLVPLLVRREAQREMPVNVASLKQRLEEAT